MRYFFFHERSQIWRSLCQFPSSLPVPFADLPSQFAGFYFGQTVRFYAALKCCTRWDRRYDNVVLSIGEVTCVTSRGWCQCCYKKKSLVLVTPASFFVFISTSFFVSDKEIFLPDIYFLAILKEAVWLRWHSWNERCTVYSLDLMVDFFHTQHKIPLQFSSKFHQDHCGILRQRV